MEVTVKLFAGLAETLGTAAVTCDLSSTATVADMKRSLSLLYPDMSLQISRALVAVNQRYADLDVAIRSTDEVALIPPVGGGSGNSNLPSCLITSDELDVSQAFKQLESVYCGGTVLFCGTVREWTKGRQTHSLTYEAYKEMAETQMRQIEVEVQTEWPGILTLQWHRIGNLNPTDTAVICAAASPHRDSAFAAAQMLIERLKKEVPIWKKEFYADGDSTWQPNERA